MVDEASMIGNERLLKLISLANKMDAGRLILAGDVKQLQAIEAGKPFEMQQRAGAPTSEISENLRASSPQMRDLNTALGEGDTCPPGWRTQAGHSRRAASSSRRSPGSEGRASSGRHL